ncbi:MAG: zinc-binding dehydrogenase [Brachymonas sp.]|nr:zinc-binding dehydrogenase [Brachymonas sp.]
MRAVIVDPAKPGATKFHWGDVPAPVPRSGEVLVQVTAVALSAWEKRVASNDNAAALSRQIGKFRVALGLEFSGIVRADGKRLRTGQRVMGGPHFTKGEKALAEFVAVAEDHLVAIPDALEATAAAVLPVSAETALRCVDAALVKADDRVLVIGAGGGVGVNVVQLAAARGAQVTAVASEAALPRLQELGAAHAYAYTTAAADGLPGPFDAVIDHSGTRRFANVAPQLARGGAFVLLDPQKDLAGLVSSLLSRRRMPLVYVPQPTAPMQERVLAHVARGELTPVVQAVYDASRLTEAFESLLHDHRVGRMVITL